ncbi:uncharacterized protein JCM6883_001279 [Sporobolomyces salmoneus]|uniref:uncharacterized protein n=1 Tax=Sporobolomyces salmoneus TaxID=183962 RepID=UPI00318124AC
MLNVPLQPFQFPPPRTAGQERDAVDKQLHQPSLSTRGPKPHRHSEKIKNALELLKTLADQAVTPVEREGSDDGAPREEGIIANLASHGWTHQTTNNGIRIFQLDHEADTFVPTPNDPTLRTGIALERVKTSTSTRGGIGAINSPGGVGMGSSTRRGARADEMLPFFRGEGWIEGSWRKEDVAATIASPGARAVWDPRFDSSKSQVVELLSESDTLLHMHIRGSFVADRDACMVTTRAGDEREGKENVLYVAACSVEDALVPSSASRTSVHLNGFAIRSLPRAPHFEPPPPPQTNTTETVLVDLPPTRPSHRRTKSSVSVLHNAQNHFLSPHPPLPTSNHLNSLSAPLHPPPPPLNAIMSSSTLATSSNGAPPSEPDSAFPFPLTFQNQASNLQTTNASRNPGVGRDGTSANRPGLAVSMLIRASPGYNLPHSMLQQLSVHLPLSIYSIGRFLSSHGFAPRIVRDQGSRVKLREEEFDANLAKYQSIFSVEEGPASEVRIRFYGGTFGRRFDVEVQHVRPEGWRIEYDVPPPPFDDPILEQTQEELGGAGSGRWKSSVTLQGPRTSNDLRQQRTRFEDSPSIGSPGSIPDDPHSSSDPALLPGPLGGCTLVIDFSATTLHLPVIVSISRPCADLASQPLAKMMRGRSKALAQAGQVALDESTLCNSFEEFLECGREGDERAELYLRGAKTVLKELEKATMEEGRTSSRLAMSALFGGGGGGTGEGWSRSPRPLASPRRLGRHPSSLSLRFANS